MHLVSSDKTQLFFASFRKTISNNIFLHRTILIYVTYYTSVQERKAALLESHAYYLFSMPPLMIYEYSDEIYLQLC